MNYTLALFTFMCYICCAKLENRTTRQTEFVSPVLQTHHRRGPHWFDFKGKTYFVNTVFKTNFYRSWQYCRLQGMNLVSIESEEENKQLQKFISDKGFKYGSYWTSGTNLVGEDQWIWMSTGRELTYTNWLPGEPSKQNVKGTVENCIDILVYAGFKWNDQNCEVVQNFICESTKDCQFCSNNSK
ncbi:collectin-12-like [Diabrotica virgifera virgifera]|uniref:Collectin-12-like n=1 Tax=Diabrotica virgifera virgifera TaxID=50390 RepID=A0A6P7GLS0_DIAVI|nr:collectin-12-like [Diabrotica virgifera virgifera]